MLKPGQKLKVTLQATDPDGDHFQTDWVLTTDAVTIGVGGDQQSPEPHIEGLTPVDGTQAVLTVPESGGAYRVFAYVTDPFGGVAVANVPIRVDAPVRLVAAASAALPYSLYDDVMNEETFVPSGYMGYTEAIRMNPACDTRPHSGSHCLKVTYLAGDAWGGVLWQSPPNDWKGAAPGGLNFQDAAQLEFWARGETGTEVVSFLVGAIEGEGPYRDSSRSELRDIKLTTDWKKYTIDLHAKDRTRIKTAFGWTVAGQGRGIDFYLDDIRYVTHN